MGPLYVQTRDVWLAGKLRGWLAGIALRQGLRSVDAFRKWH